MFFFFKQKTAYEMRISDWSSDVCSSDLLKHMDLVWGSPTVKKPGADQQITLFIERGMPGCVAVNRKGKRFVNEAAAYPDFRNAMYADDAKGNGTVPCWLVFDATFRYKYPKIGRASGGESVCPYVEISGGAGT